MGLPGNFAPHHAIVDATISWMDAMRSRSPLHVRFLRYGLLTLSLLFAGGIVFLGVTNMTKVEADPLVDYRPVPQN